MRSSSLDTCHRIAPITTHQMLSRSTIERRAGEQRGRTSAWNSCLSPSASGGAAVASALQGRSAPREAAEILPADGTLFATLAPLAALLAAILRAMAVSSLSGHFDQPIAASTFSTWFLSLTVYQCQLCNLLTIRQMHACTCTSLLSN